MPSETGTSAQARSDLPDAAIRAQLERILAQRRSSPDPSSCGASSRSSSNNAWPGRDTRSKNRSSPTSCTGRERTSMAVPIRWFGSTPGGCATNCASTTRADPIPSSSRCRRAATCPSSKRIPPHAPRRDSSGCSLRSRAGDASGSNFGRARDGRRRSGGRRGAGRRRDRLARTRQPASAPVQLLPLASYPGVEGPPALSPDGNLVAFAWSGHAEPGPTDIYVKAVGSEALRRLTATPDSETSPAWSPDGHSIAFVRDGQGVFTMSQLGGAERQVSASGTHVAWAGDSKSVLIRDREGNTGPFGIYQVFLDTLERRRLTQAPVGAGDWRFDSLTGRQDPGVHTLREGRESRTCTSCPWQAANRGGSRTGTHTMYGLSWTPDGREIVYSVEEPASQSAVANPREQRPTCSRIADRRHPRGGRESVDLEADARAAGTPCLSNDHPRRRPSPDGPRRAPGERHHRVAALFEFDSHRGFGAILARRQPDCVRVVPFRSLGDVGRWTRWERTSAGHDAGRCWSVDRWMVPGRRTDRVRSSSRRQY